MITVVVTFFLRQIKPLTEVPFFFFLTSCCQTFGQEDSSVEVVRDNSWRLDEALKSRNLGTRRV